MITYPSTRCRPSWSSSQQYRRELNKMNNYVQSSSYSSASEVPHDEAEGLRRSLGRVDFLVQQGFISEKDAESKKQEVIDSFVLSPMVELQQQKQQQHKQHKQQQQQQQQRKQRQQNLKQQPAPSPYQDQVHTLVETAASHREEDADDGAGDDVDAGHDNVDIGCPFVGPGTTSNVPSPSQPGTEQTARQGIRDAGEDKAGPRINTTPPHRSHMATTSTTRADHAEQLGEPLAVEPESPGGAPVAECTENRSTSGSASTSSSAGAGRCGNVVSRAPGSASTRSLSTSSTASSATSSPSGPVSRLDERDERRLVRQEAEPTPATVPDPADLKRGTCEWPHCDKEPHYALRGQRARTCYVHKQEDWVHVSRRRCDSDGCARGAYFGLEGSTALFCSAHRTSAMQDVVNLRRYRCDEDGCDRQAYYNYPGVSGAKAKFCSTHKLPTMINVRHRLCEKEGCGKTPTYSVQGSRPRFCASHKEPGMVDTKSKMCAFMEPGGANCTRCRLYGDPDGKATFCLVHKKEGMVNIRQARKRKRS